VGKPVILLVEDDDILAQIEELRLKKMGYEICGVASSGDEAVSMADKFHPDLIMMDIALPGDLDGIAAAEEIRKTQRIPIIYVTAHSGEDLVERAKKTIPDGYIIKPFRDEDLRVAIELALYKKEDSSRSD
jgi:two-component system, response regulator PdtaR